MSRNGQPNLFTKQPDLFGPPPRQTYEPTLEKVRSELNKALDSARAATLTPKQVAYWKTVFPQMTRWLPAEEAAEMRFAFMEELRRLTAA